MGLKFITGAMGKSRDTGDIHASRTYWAHNKRQQMGAEAWRARFRVCTEKNSQEILPTHRIVNKEAKLHLQ